MILNIVRFVEEVRPNLSFALLFEVDPDFSEQSIQYVDYQALYELRDHNLLNVGIIYISSQIYEKTDCVVRIHELVSGVSIWFVYV